MLCDTGSLICLIPACAVQGVELQPTSVRLFSASAQPIAALGSVVLPVVIAGVRMSVTFIVSDEVGEIILGYEFLRDQGCEWAVGRNEMKIRGKTVRMVRREGSGVNVRRVYVRETISIPPNSSGLVAVRMPHSRVFAHGVDLGLPPVPSAKCSGWLLESTPLQRERVFTAHSLLPEDDRGAVVSVMNLGDRTYWLSQGRLLGVAGEAVYLGTLVENISLKGERENASSASVVSSAVDLSKEIKDIAQIQGSITDAPLVRDSVRDSVSEQPLTPEGDEQPDACLAQFSCDDAIKQPNVPPKDAPKETRDIARIPGRQRRLVAVGGSWRTSHVGKRSGGRVSRALGRTDKNAPCDVRSVMRSRSRPQRRSVSKPQQMAVECSLMRLRNEPQQTTVECSMMRSRTEPQRRLRTEPHYDDLNVDACVNNDTSSVTPSVSVGMDCAQDCAAVSRICTKKLQVCTLHATCTD